MAATDLHLRFRNVRVHFIHCLQARGRQPLRFSAERINEIRSASAGAESPPPLPFMQGIPESRKGWLPAYKPRSLRETQGYRYPLSRPNRIPVNVDDEQALLYADGWRGSRLFAKRNLIGGKDSYVWNDSSRRLLNSRGWPVGVTLLSRVRSDGLVTVTTTVALDKRDLPGFRREGFTIRQIQPLVRLVPVTEEQFHACAIGEFCSHFADPHGTYEDVTLRELVERELEAIGNDLALKPLFPEMFNGGLGQAAEIQAPYLVFDGELESEVHESYFDFSRHTEARLTARFQDILPELAALLLRFFDVDLREKIAAPFIRKELGLSEDGSYPPSMSPNSDVFCYAYRSAALVLSKGRSDIPARFVIPSFLDIAESYRARRHALMIGNLLLDYVLAAGDEATAGSGFPSDSMSERRRYERTELVRRIVGSQIANPAMILHDGHVGFDLPGMIDKPLGLETLESAVERKFRILEDLVSTRGWFAEEDTTDPMDSAKSADVRSNVKSTQVELIDYLPEVDGEDR